MTQPEVHRWTVRVEPPIGDPFDIEVLSMGASVGLRVKDGKPAWIDYQASAQVSSAINHAGNLAARHAPVATSMAVSGRHRAQQTGGSRARDDADEATEEWAAGQRCD